MLNKKIVLLYLGSNKCRLGEQKIILLKNIKNITVQKLFIGSVYHIYIYIYSGGRPFGPKNDRADFLCPRVQPWVQLARCT